MRMFLLLLCAVLFTQESALCQDIEEAAPKSATAMHRIGASIGITDLNVKDEYASPYIFNGIVFSTRVSYHATLEQSRHEIEFGFVTGTIASDMQPIDVKEKGGSVSYAYSRSMHRWNADGRTLELFAGAGISTFVMNSDYLTPKTINWFAPVDQAWYWSHALDLHATAEYAFGEQSTISLKASLPVVRIDSRPDPGHYNAPRTQKVQTNFLRAATRGQAEYLWDNFSAFFEMEYRHPIGDGADVRGTYAFSYASSDRPLSMGMYMNQFFVGIDIRL
jgi:hypothetical protein